MSSRGQKRSSDSNDRGSKRQKNDLPSRVVFLRNLPNMTTDAEINEVCSRFGVLVNIMRIDAKNQAFVEFEHLDSAKELIRSYNGQFPIQGKVASAMYSDRQYISFTRELDENPPNRILFVIITLQIHPVDCDTLYQVFSRVGKVRKVVLQTKAVQLQGFVEMETIAQATEAKTQFNHKHIYACSCKLSIAYAKLQSLDCSDSHLSKDYTLEGDREDDGLLNAPSCTALTVVPKQSDDRLFFPNSRRSVTPDDDGCVLLVNGIDDKTTPEDLFHLFSTCGDVMKVRILFNKRNSALLEFRNADQARISKDMLQDCPFSGRRLHIVPSSKQSIIISKGDNQDADLSRDFSHSPLHRFREEGSPYLQLVRSPCETLHVTNIPANIDEESLMDIFQPYGARQAELFHRKATMGLVAFKSTESAVNALMAMNGWDWNTPGSRPMILAFAKTSGGSLALTSSNSSMSLQGRGIGSSMLDPMMGGQLAQMVPNTVVYPVYESPVFPMSQMQMVPMSQMQALPMSQMQAMPMPQMQTMPMPQVQTVPMSQLQSMPVSQVQTIPTTQMQPMSVSQMQTLPVTQVQTMPVPQMQGVPVSQMQGMQVPQMQTVGQFPMTSMPQQQPLGQLSGNGLPTGGAQFSLPPGQGMAQFPQSSSPGQLQMVTSMAPAQMMTTMPGPVGDVAFQGYAQRAPSGAGFAMPVMRQQVPVSQLAMLGSPGALM